MMGISQKEMSSETRIRSNVFATTRAMSLLASAALVASMFACSADSESPPLEEARKSAPAPIMDVETASIRRGSIVQRISAPSSLFARREALIGAEVRGRLTQIHVDEGSQVEPGDPLFQVDPEPYRLALRRADAARDRARAERRQLKNDLARGRALRKKNIMAEEETDRIATGLEVAEAAEREADEAVAMAQRDLDHATVRAPFAGAITRRLVDEGSTALVQPQTIVLVLQETHNLVAVATIAEVHFAAIQPGDVALLHIDGLPLPIPTEVDVVGDSIDSATRTFRVHMRVPNPERRLKSGLFARVEILPRAKSQVLLAPRAALRNQDGHTHVLAVRDGYAVERRIEIGLISEDAVEVLAGLHVDDEVVVGDAARRLGPGMRVRTKQPIGDLPVAEGAGDSADGERLRSAES